MLEIKVSVEQEQGKEGGEKRLEICSWNGREGKERRIKVNGGYDLHWKERREGGRGFLYRKGKAYARHLRLL